MMLTTAVSDQKSRKNPARAVLYMTAFRKTHTWRERRSMGWPNSRPQAAATWM
jgi:hypothetical protein